MADAESRLGRETVPTAIMVILIHQTYHSRVLDGTADDLVDVARVLPKLGQWIAPTTVTKSEN